MGEPFEIFGIDVELGAKWSFVELPLGALIDDRPLAAVEGRAVNFAFQKILADFRADFFETKTNIGEDGIIAPERVLLLQQVKTAKASQSAA
jgi:hypothetical protein